MIVLIKDFVSYCDIPQSAAPIAVEYIRQQNKGALLPEHSFGIVWPVLIFRLLPFARAQLCLACCPHWCLDIGGSDLHSPDYRMYAKRAGGLANDPYVIPRRTDVRIWHFYRGLL